MNPSKKDKNNLKILILKKEWDELLKKNQLHNYALMRKVAKYRKSEPRKTEMNFKKEEWYKEGRETSKKTTEEIVKIKEEIKKTGRQDESKK
tara:strand:+ start:892 stop:1167 length:276 start_codon:yes stop_codon:yes gene_type:complete